MVKVKENNFSKEVEDGKKLGDTIDGLLGEAEFEFF